MSIQRQLGFLQQLLMLVPGSKEPSGSRADTEMLLNELCASENVTQLSHMLTPTLDPWPSHIKYVQRFLPFKHRSLLIQRSDVFIGCCFSPLTRSRTASRASRGASKEAADVGHLLQQSCCALEQLQAEVLILNEVLLITAAVSPPGYHPCLLLSVTSWRTMRMPVVPCCRPVSCK